MMRNTLLRNLEVKRLRRKGLGALFLYSVVTFVLIMVVLFKADIFKNGGYTSLPSAVEREVHGKDTQCASGLCRTGKQKQRVYKIGWIKYPIHIMLRPDAMFSGFDGCQYSNCIMSYIQEEAQFSDAVIFTGRIIPDHLNFARPMGQVWIFYEHEPPFRYGEVNDRWNQNKTFNWTIHYDPDIADIHVPYGRIRKRKPIKKDYEQIMRRKNGTALMVMSHCDTPAERMKFVDELSKHVDVDVLGQCGMSWNCGQRFLHNDCFELINKYKFYLAFENSFCSNYFTEKIYDNYDYDTVLVSRGGKKGQVANFVPDGTIVTTHDFKNAKELGNYLKTMTPETYMTMLQRKTAYTSLDSYVPIFHQGLCDLCKRMNHLEKYRKVIDDMNDLIYSSTPCVPPPDLD